MIPSSLNISYSFDAAQFRDSIHFAMEMGTHPDPAKRPRFLFKSAGRTYSKAGTPVTNPRTDRDGWPLDPEVKVIEIAPVEVTVPCALEIKRQPVTHELTIGPVRPTRISVTVLDVDYDQIRGCAEMVYGGDRFAFDFEEYNIGLFEVGICVLVFLALDES